MTFGDKVKTLRSLKGWSQRDLTQHVGGVSVSAVSAWENGAIPAMDAALRTARALGVSLDFLADDTQDAPPSAEENPRHRQVLEIVERIGPDRVYWLLLDAGLDSSRPPGSAGIGAPAAGARVVQDSLSPRTKRTKP